MKWLLRALVSAFFSFPIRTSPLTSRYRRGEGCIMTLTVRAMALLAAAVLTGRSLSAWSAESDTQARGNWIDPATGLMWAAKDNGRDVNWLQATDYCAHLESSGYSDWRVPTIGELKGVFAPGIEAKKYPAFRVKGDLALSGDSWSANDLADA